jgi:hypothetical protein
MIDPILKKATERRDESLRQAERREAWIKAYAELATPTEDPLDIPMGHSAASLPKGVDIASSLRGPAISKGKDGI